MYSRIKNLKSHPRWAKVSITDDLTPEENCKRQDLKSICAHAKQNRIDARVSGNALVIEGRHYSHLDLGKLPHGLSLEKAKTIRRPLVSNQSKNCSQNITRSGVYYGNFRFIS